MKPTFISLPAICVLIVTVASGVTVPSASMVIGMSPDNGFGGAHGLRRRPLRRGGTRRLQGRGSDVLVIEPARDQGERERQDDDEPRQPIASRRRGRRRGAITGEGVGEWMGRGAGRASATVSRLTVSFIRQFPDEAFASPWTAPTSP